MVKKSWFFIVSISVTVLVLSAATFRNDNLFQIAKNLDIFATLFKEVNTYYVDPIDPELLINAGIKGMLGSLDPYTDYIPSANLEDYRTVTTGQYGGIGALVGQRNGQSVVIYPYEGFPAQKAGLQIGDIVTKIDGQPIAGMSNNETSKLLKGKSDTPIMLTIKRYGNEQEKEFQLFRENITIKNVPYSGMVDKQTGYIKLSDFTTDAGLEVKNALKDLKSEGASSIILDLRGNPGGLLDQAIEIANLFIPKGGTVVSTKGKTDNWDQKYIATLEPFEPSLPLVVLTDRSSASAAEIVSGVIQDYDRGVLVGRRTFGKGLVQSTRSLAFDAQLKLTTAKYYIPSGRCIQAIDYSLRREDGSVGTIPDSLKMPFKTMNNRVVYDGGGIQPDINVEQPKYASISYQLISSNIIFDYATMYHFENPTKPVSARSFSLSETEYNDFSDWVLKKEFNYVTKVEKEIEDLEKNAKDEKYYEMVQKDIESLKAQLSQQKINDFTRFKPEIKELLEQEIITRYYYQSGVIEYTFSKDQDILRALNIISDQQKFGQILKPVL
jgi:carboxyl-terminal processing protease